MPLVYTTGTSSLPRSTVRKGKLEIQVLLLLHVLIPGVMLSSLETINPWLSACDLKQQDPKGSCSATTRFPAGTAPLPDVESVCPNECPTNESQTNASCLAYLDETRRNAICNFNLGNGIEWLKSFLGTIRLRHCCEYKIIESLSSSLLERVLGGKEECFRIVDSLVEVDNLAARVTCEFSEVLTRYDCGQPYSVKFSCNDCLEAYRRWVCSTLVPYYNESVRIRPCRSVCQAVEQKCPYFLPENKAPALPTQYAGEPTFLCMDPNIPETGEQQKRSLYPDENTCCVQICGSLKEGLCVEKGAKCKSEELVSYEEALDQTVGCFAGEATGPRVPSMECTASEPYSSPHKLGSGVRRSLPGPVLVLTSACLNRELSRGLSRGLRSTLPVLLLLLAVPLGLRPGTSVARFASENRLFFQFVKRLDLIFNYLKFDSNKWQYYFILISVNLIVDWLLRNPEPLMTPVCFADGVPSVRTRRARRYYYNYFFYYNYYDYYSRKRYYVILSRIAQNSNGDDLECRRAGDSKDAPLSLVAINVKPGGYFFRVNSLTINRIHVYRHNCKKIIVTVAPTGEGEGFPLGRRRTKRSVETVAVRGTSTRARAFASVRRCGTSVQKLTPAKLWFSSDPKCEFQTFLKIS